MRVALVKTRKDSKTYERDRITPAIQTVDKVLLLQGLAIVRTAFSDIIKIRRSVFFMMIKNADKK